MLGWKFITGDAVSEILNHVFRLACIIVRGAVVERVDNKLAGSWLVERFSPVCGII